MDAKFVRKHKVLGQNTVVPWLWGMSMEKNTNDWLEINLNSYHQLPTIKQLK